MKKTYVTTVPNHIGAFLAASRLFAGLEINITRVSYHKAIDSHTIFIEAEGSARQLKQADEALQKLGYLRTAQTEQDVTLLEFQLRDVPGAVSEVLALIEQYSFNLCYLNSQQTDRPYQLFQMGLNVDDPGRLADFLQQARALCPVRVVEYDRTEQSFDNSLFYDAFVSGLCRTMQLAPSARERLLIHTNLAMQTLQAQGLSPARTFETIRLFAELLAKYRGAAFCPRISRHELSEKTQLTLIEPPCGSNTAILQSEDEVLVLDSGYACYKDEMLPLLRQFVPQFDTRHKTIFVTHADVDHCGLLELFDEVILSAKSAQCLQLEFAQKDGFREQNPLHRPYIQICKCLTGYRPPQPKKLRARFGTLAPVREPLTAVGTFAFGDLHFAVYEGVGGHLPGELLLVDEQHQLAFTGDVYVNLHGMTPEQTAYNQYAPILMTSVDTDPALCAQQRRALLRQLRPGQWRIFGAHGAPKELEIEEERKTE